MSLRLIVRPEAETDIERALRWYEKQNPGLGTEFLRAVDACISSIERQPDLRPPYYRQARRAMLRRFPYAVFYVIQAETVEVFAVVHVRRSPERWRSRI